MMTSPAVLEQASRDRVYRPKPRRPPELRATTTAVAAAVTLFSLFALPPAEAADKKVTVEIANFTYSPNVITVNPGTTVTWVNHDDIPHTVTASGKAFRSNALDTDDSFTFTFTLPGDYAYFCALHPRMTAKVVVRRTAGEANGHQKQRMLARNGL